MLVFPAADSPVIQNTRPGACILQIVTLKNVKECHFALEHLGNSMEAVGQWY
jgi:hypothetical protein